MPFDQQLSFPTELSLRRIADQFRLCKQPIREIETIQSAVLNQVTSAWDEYTEGAKY